VKKWNPVSLHISTIMASASKTMRSASAFSLALASRDARRRAA